MNDIDIRLLETLKDNDERALASAENILSHAPKGNLEYRTIRGHRRFYRHYPKTLSESAESEAPLRPKYLNAGNASLIKSLAAKRYCEALCPPLREEINTLAQFIDNYHPEKKYQALNNVPQELHEQIAPLFHSSADICAFWQAQPFNSNPYDIHPDTSYKTIRGELVRSRAECLLCDKVGRRPLAYHYEELLRIGKTEIYPDITIMHPQTCEKYYLEFFGMMDNPEYAKKAIRKIQFYQAAGLGPRLIPIFDCREAPFNFDRLDAILDSYFGKQ